MRTCRYRRQTRVESYMYGVIFLLSWQSGASSSLFASPTFSLSFSKCAATEVEGTFRVNGSNKRMRELQAVFETPPRVRVFLHTPPSYTHCIATAPQYGKSLDWKAENYTTHDVASVFRRYLTHMPVRCPTLMSARAPILTTSVADMRVFVT